MALEQQQARRLLPAWSAEQFTVSRIWVSLSLLVLLSLLLPPPAIATRSRTKPAAKRRGVTHVVEHGQTLFRISQAYQVKVGVLMTANHLKSSTPLKVGQRLLIPGARVLKRVDPFRSLTTEQRRTLELSLREEVAAPPPPPEPPHPRVKTDAEFLWPMLGPINSPFGPRWGKFHAGIDIGSPHYQEVVAAGDGEVIYANETGGSLGKAIVLQHGRGLRTVYAHLSTIIAREGDTVRQGQAIGGVGETGRTTGPHLHFEVRKNAVPVNPEDHLPATIDDLVRDLSRQR